MNNISRDNVASNIKDLIAQFHQIPGISSHPNFNKWNSLINKSKSYISTAPTQIIEKKKTKNVDKGKNSQKLYSIVNKLITMAEVLFNNPVDKLDNNSIDKILNNLVLAAKLRKEQITIGGIDLRIDEFFQAVLGKESDNHFFTYEEVREDPFYLEKVVTKLIDNYSKNYGGFVLLSQLMRDLRGIIRDFPHTIEEIEKILLSLKQIGLVHSIREKSDGLVIETIPFSLSTDRVAIIEMARHHNGVLNLSLLIGELNWVTERVYRAMNVFVEDKIAIYNETIDEGKVWYFQQLYDPAKDK